MAPLEPRRPADARGRSVAGRRRQPPRRRASTPARSPDNLVLRAIGRDPRAVRARARRGAAGARGPPRQADPRRRGARRRQQRRRRGDRRRARGVGRATRSSPPSERSRLAASIGSDVPFFLAGGPALVEGRGERVTPLHGLRLGPGEARPGLAARDAGRSRPTRPRCSRPGRAGRWASPASRRGARSTSRASSAPG